MFSDNPLASTTIVGKSGDDDDDLDSNSPIESDEKYDKKRKAQEAYNRRALLILVVLGIFALLVYSVAGNQRGLFGFRKKRKHKQNLAQSWPGRQQQRGPPNPNSANKLRQHQQQQLQPGFENRFDDYRKKKQMYQQNHQKPSNNIMNDPGDRKTRMQEKLDRLTPEQRLMYRDQYGKREHVGSGAHDDHGNVLGKDAASVQRRQVQHLPSQLSEEEKLRYKKRMLEEQKKEQRNQHEQARSTHGSNMPNNIKPIRNLQAHPHRTNGEGHQMQQQNPEKEQLNLQQQQHRNRKELLEARQHGLDVDKYKLYKEKFEQQAKLYQQQHIKK